jgi:hypothetical protein
VIVRSFDISLPKLIRELLGKKTAGSLVVVYGGRIRILGVVCRGEGGN